MKEMTVRELLVKSLKEKLTANSVLNIQYRNYVEDREEYVEVSFNKDVYTSFDYDSLSKFKQALEEAFEDLKKDLPFLKKQIRCVDFIFGHYGYTSSSAKDMITQISTDGNVIVKTGKVTAEYDGVCISKFQELIEKYPSYEIYLRRGFRFRGATERMVTKEVAIND